MHDLRFRLPVLGAICLLAGSALSATESRGEDWPQWRGPAGTGVSQERGLPIFWDESRSIVWKCQLPEWGASTPVIHGDAIFLTSHTADDRLLLLRIARRSGQIEWTRQVGSGKAPRDAPKRERQKFHQLHNLASPSPVTDGKYVVVHFGNGDLAAYDFAGEQIWRRNLQEDYGPYTIWWGHANSPVLIDGLVISVCMQDSLADTRDTPVESYLVAHDVRDGHVKWKQPRMTGAPAEQADAYTTPLLVTQDGRRQLIVMGGNQVDAYDPQTGKQLWYLPGIAGGRTVTGPTVADNRLIVTQGQKGPLLAIELGKQGELTRRDIAWKFSSGTPDSCSPVAWNRLLFTISDDGIARCLDLISGNLKWKSRLPGSYKASPMAADGRIYFLNTSGVCTVISATSHFDKLTENKLNDETLASPAVSQGQIFLRGRQRLYCLGQ